MRRGGLLANLHHQIQLVIELTLTSSIGHVSNLSISAVIWGGHTIQPSHFLLPLDIFDLDLVLYRFPHYLLEGAVIS
jgi:hypothetical protein